MTECKDVTTTLLLNWAKQTIVVYIHVYSLSMASKDLFVKAKKALIDPMYADRAGAPAISAIDDLVAELQELHKFNFVGTRVAWCLWANHIHAAEPHLRERLKLGPPSADILHMFNRAPNHPDTVIQDLRANCEIARNVYATHLLAINECRTALNDVSATRDQLNLKIDFLDRKLQRLEIHASSSDTLLNTFHSIVDAEDTDISNDVFNRVTNSEDIDHAVP